MTDWIICPEFSRALVAALFHSIWQGGLIALILLLVERTKSFSSLKMYRLSLVGLFILFSCTLFTFLFFHSGGTLNVVSHSLVETTDFSSGFVKNNNESPWQELIAWLWLAGCIIWGLKSILGLQKLTEYRRNSRPVSTQWINIIDNLSASIKLSRKVRLLLSDRIQRPLVHGVLKPVILFPATYITHLTPDQIESILLHELTHIKQNDFLVNLLQIMIESILFFNPSCWWISRNIRRYREYHCDDSVIKHVENPNTYLRALYEAASISKVNENYSIALFNHKNELTMRIKRMLNHNTDELSARFWGKLSLLIFLAIGFLSFKYFEEIKPQFHQNELENPVLEQKLDQLGYTLATLKSFTLNQRVDSENVPPLLFASRDTSPELSNKRTEELNRKIEEKSKKLEQISELMAKEIEQNIEIDAQHLEELARQLEEKMEPLTRQLEEEIMDSESMKRLEELEKRLEGKLEKNILELEKSFSEEKMKSLELEMEELARKIEEEYQNSEKKEDSDKMKRYNEEMQYLNQQIHDKTKDLNMAYDQLMLDPEIKVLKEEIDELVQNIEPIQPLFDDLMSEEMKTIQNEMNELQSKINENMQGFQEDWHDQIKELSMEIEILSSELTKEYEELREKN